MNKIIKPILLSLLLVFCARKSEISNLDFTLKSIDGETVSLSDFKGKVVLLDFWATWCPPCRRSIPHLISLYEKYKDRGVIIIGISSEEEGTIRNFRDENGITYPLLLGTSEVFQKYKVSAIPHTVFIDKKGKERKTQIGFADELIPEFEALIEKLVNE
uniref:TlpA family protein disulfide reductase n=1 Tax=candidate division WOR-3 bacterium TaxID=2052148 RepID=A0A7C4TCJ4_UNCW3